MKKNEKKLSFYLFIPKKSINFAADFSKKGDTISNPYIINLLIFSLYEENFNSFHGDCSGDEHDGYPTSKKGRQQNEACK